MSMILDRVRVAMKKRRESPEVHALKALVGKRILAVKTEEIVGDLTSFILRLDDGSVVRIGLYTHLCDAAALTVLEG